LNDVFETIVFSCKANNTARTKKNTRWLAIQLKANVNKVVTFHTLAKYVSSPGKCLSDSREDSFQILFPFRPFLWHFRDVPNYLKRPDSWEVMSEENSSQKNFPTIRVSEYNPSLIWKGKILVRNSHPIFSRQNREIKEKWSVTKTCTRCATLHYAALCCCVSTPGNTPLCPAKRPALKPRARRHPSGVGTMALQPLLLHRCISMPSETPSVAATSESLPLTRGDISAAAVAAPLCLNA
jgi:hypothetical protein